MEKAFFIVMASALTAKEAQAGGFPLSGEEGWQYLFVLLAAVFASLATESSKRRKEDVFFAPAFWGSVGLGVMAGLALPLLLTALFEHFSHQGADWKASVGLSILGAYTGRDALKALWTTLQSLGTLLARLKGMNISFPTPPTPPAPPTPPNKEGEDDT